MMPSAVLSVAAAAGGVLLRNSGQPFVWLVAMLLFYLMDCVFERKKRSILFAVLLIGANIAAGGTVSISIIPPSPASR